MNYSNYAKVFKTLCDETGSRIIKRIQVGEICACKLAKMNISVNAFAPYEDIG